jgi:hypothetical protein
MRVYIDGALVTTCPMSEAGLRRTTDKMYIGAGIVVVIPNVLPPNPAKDLEGSSA